MMGSPASVRTLRYSLCLALAFLFVGLFPVPGLPETTEPLRKVLSNGMTVILIENHAAPVVSIQAWVKAGSAQESEQECGMSHVLEHMLFKGTENRGVGAIAREVEASGGMINAYTSWEMTVYYVNMASRFMDKGIEILADIMQNATLDPEELAREKPVILEELRRGKDLPARMFSKAFFREAYTKHAYGLPVIGFEENIRNFTREQLLAFYKKWYVPENIVWVMAGDLDSEELMPRLEERLSRIPAEKMPHRPQTVEPPQSKPRSFVLNMDVAEARLKIGFHIPDIMDPDVPALDLLAQVLGQGQSSRLYHAFRSKQRLLNSVYAYAMTPKDPGLFIVGARLEAGDLEKALYGIFEEMWRCGFEPVGQEELNKARGQLESDFIYEKETVQGQSRELGYYESVTGELDFGDQYLERLRSVKSEDLVRVAHRYLRPGSMTVGVLLPESSDTKISEKKILKKAKKIHKRLKARYLKDAPDTGDNGEEVIKTRLPNGAVLLVKENHAVPLVSCQAVFLGGLLTETPDTAGISNFVAAMLTKGTASRTAEQIAEEIESLAGSVSGFSGRNSFGLTSQVVSWNFPAAFEIFSDILLHPEFPSEYVEKTRKDVLAAIKNSEDNLSHLAFQLFWKSLYPCHPYGLDRLGTADTIAKLRREDLSAYYGKEVVASNLVLAIVGDVDAGDVKKIADRLLTQLPDQPFVQPEIACGTEPRRLSVKHVSPDKLQSHIVVGARGASFWDKERYSLDVLQAVLSGQGGRLFMDLRDRQSLAYTVTAFNRDAFDPGSFGVYMATMKRNREKAVAEIYKALEQIRRDGITGEELNRAKNYLLGSYDLSIQTSASQASLMASYERYGLGYREYQLYPEYIEAVTAKQVKKAARKVLCPECLVEAVVTPEGSGKEASIPDSSDSKAPDRAEP